MRAAPAPLRSTTRAPRVARSDALACTGAVWLGYLASGVLGALLVLRWDLWVLVLPLAALIALIAIDLSRRI